jgi:hypothetical protein
VQLGPGPGRPRIDTVRGEDAPAQPVARFEQPERDAARVQQPRRMEAGEAAADAAFTWAVAAA